MIQTAVQMHKTLRNHLLPYYGTKEGDEVRWPYTPPTLDAQAQTEPAVANRSVHTGCKQYQMKLPSNLRARVLCELLLTRDVPLQDEQDSCSRP